MAPRAKPEKKDANGLGHNGPPPTPEQREADFLRNMDACRRFRAATDDAKAGMKAIRKQETVVRNTAKQAGFSLKVIDEILADEAKTRADIVGYEEQRAWARGTVGLANGRQADLFDTPEAKTEFEWGENGYNAGLRGEPAKPPAEMPPEYVQLWMGRHVAGKERLAWAMAESGLNPDRSRTDIGLGSQVPPPDDDQAAAEPEGDQVAAEAEA